jgi:hypothetical protein
MGVFWHRLGADNQELLRQSGDRRLQTLNSLDDDRRRSSSLHKPGVL